MEEEEGPPHLSVHLCVCVRLCVCPCQYVSLGSSHVLDCHVCQHVALMYKSSISAVTLASKPLPGPGRVVDVLWLSLKVYCSRAW